jgi:hypothetical protein
MDYDRINTAELARRAGIDRRRAKSAAWHNGASFRDNGARVITEHDAQKIAARARFAQRLVKRQDKQREEFADNMRPRVTVDMGGAK